MRGVNAVHVSLDMLEECPIDRCSCAMAVALPMLVG